MKTNQERRQPLQILAQQVRNTLPLSILTSADQVFVSQDGMTERVKDRGRISGSFVHIILPVESVASAFGNAKKE